jgi:hypothetical protein
MTNQLFRDFDEWVENRMEENKANGLAPLWGRAWEHAAKLALGMACARYDAAKLKEVATGGGLEIDQTSAQWSIDFVKFTLCIQQEQVASRMGDSDFDRQAQETLRVIQRSGQQGRTHAQIAEFCRMFRALKPTDQDAVLDSLKRRELIALVQYRPPSGRGKSRMAWVSKEFVPDNEEDGEGE